MMQNNLVSWASRWKHDVMSVKCKMAEVKCYRAYLKVKQVLLTAGNADGAATTITFHSSNVVRIQQLIAYHGLCIQKK